MKRLVILLALLLAVACVPAFAAEGDRILGRDGETSIYFSRAFESDGVLYLPDGGSRLYTWSVGDAELTEYTFDLVDESRKTAYDVSVVPFACDGRLYAITLTTTYDEHTEFEGAALNEITLRPDGTIGLEALMDVEWDDLLEYYDQDVYASQPSDIVAAGGKAYLLHYDSQYENVVSVLNLKNGRMKEVDELADAFALVPYRDGKLLAEKYSYTRSSEASLLVYDPEEDSAQLLAELKIDDYSPLKGLAYDAGTDTVYCLKSGEVCPVDIGSGEVLVGVTDMPLESYGASAGCVLEGGWYVYASDGAAIRNLDPGQRADVRMKIVDDNYTGAVTDAYTRFANAHGDVSLVLSRDYSDATNLVSNMMNRDDSVDIYTLYTSNASYDALFNRGYMMELDGVGEIEALAEGMYPSLRECLSRDGHMVALPLDAYAWCFSANEKALEALGMTLEDVPDNWWDFLDFLPSLEKPLAENKSVRLGYDGVSASDMRNQLFYAIFDDYQRYVNVVDPNLGYDTELLRGLLHKLEGIDFIALGCAEDADEDDMNGMGRTVTIGPDAESVMMLFDTYCPCSVGTNYSDGTPIQMGLDADKRCPLVLEAVVAFVNPYTKHPELAMEFMAEIARNLPNTVRYDISPDLSEPIRGAMYEQSMEEVRQELEKLRLELESAEPAEVQMLEDEIKTAEENLAYWEEKGWEISGESVEWYRAHAEAGVVVAPVNWLYADDSGEAWELMSQYRDGSISAEEMLRNIDRKVQMMMMEGN